ncbi:hypothetical protein F4677DRAFT_450919 [Hypoxylon crocopeplum]|nr:hypothetical protein F4677DRAFT_450919 [Hypoxylon crocopeplum]
MASETQRALQQAAALADASATPTTYGTLRFEPRQQWDPTPRSVVSAQISPDPSLDAAVQGQGSHHEDGGLVATGQAAGPLAEPPVPGQGSLKHSSVGQAPARASVTPPDNIIEWRSKFFDISQNPLTLPKQQWDDIWIWIDNIWTPRRVPYTKKDGIVHYEWRCRYHKKVPLPSQSTGKRRREIRRGYGCPARMTANLVPDTGMFQVEGFEAHNHGLQELDSTKICSGVRKWTSMHVQMGLQPKQIEALINGNDVPEAGGTREALDTAGGKLLDEKTIRNIARRWRWPAAKFHMRQDELFRELHSQHNTFPFAIQEPEAFHRDVCEVANEAQTPDELHRLLDGRKELRLRELDERFDAAASHLTMDPGSVGQQHWDHVLRLFRDRSYDALVRYFTAYIRAEEMADNEALPSHP